MANKWIEHVLAYQAKHPKLSYGECMKSARASYTKVKSAVKKSSVKKSTKKKGGKLVVPMSMNQVSKKQLLNVIRKANL